MGMFFSNLHIKKNNTITLDSLLQYLIEDMVKKGYTRLESPENSEVTIAIYAPENSSWVSVSSDCYNFNSDEDTRNTAQPISEKFGTYVIAASCMDSDYAFMHLLNSSDKTDGWINSGSVYEGMELPRNTTISGWEKIISDFDRFREITNEEYIFAEDMIYNIAELMNMDKEQCLFEADYTEDVDKNCLTKLYFSLLPISEEEPANLHINLYSLTPCKADINSVVFVNNKGGRSKGVAIMFTGDYIENDDVIIYNATFESCYGSENCKIVPITLEKRKRSDGSCVLWWEDSDFEIPPAVNQNLPYTKREKLEFEKQFGVRFFVKGNPQKFRDVEVYIIPLENIKSGYAQGYDRWNAQKRPLA